MPLGVDEIAAGCVAYFNGEKLLADDAVSKPDVDMGVIGDRPFLCTYASGGTSKWIKLTSQKGDNRFAIKKYKTSGPHSWMVGESYINDLRDTFSGPDISFVAASDPDFASHNRPKISGEGVQAVLSAVEVAEANELLRIQQQNQPVYVYQPVYFQPYPPPYYQPPYYPPQQYPQAPYNPNSFGQMDGTGLWYPPGY